MAWFYISRQWMYVAHKFCCMWGNAILDATPWDMTRALTRTYDYLYLLYEWMPCFSLLYVYLIFFYVVESVSIMFYILQDPLLNIDLNSSSVWMGNWSQLCPTCKVYMIFFWVFKKSNVDTLLTVLYFTLLNSQNKLSLIRFSRIVSSDNKTCPI